MSARLPEPASSDLAAWRRLVREARRSAADPAASCGDLAKAEKSAKRAIVLGVLDRENPCVQLVRGARQFTAATVRQRRDLADRMAELAGQVEERLQARSTKAAEPPARRLRADIDG